jgi:Fe2+ or Zn2+ uptake regulation protein
MAGKHELHEKGLRLTPQRELVLSAVRALGHATPEEVAEKVRQTHPGINLSTVYRNLALKQSFGANAGTVYYAAKAFICTEVARWIKDIGIGIDVCTGGNSLLL